MTMPSPPPPGDQSTEQDSLQAALQDSRRLRQLPVSVEAAFRRHYQDQVAGLLRRYVAAIIALALLLVVPIVMFHADPVLPPWLAYTVTPILVVVVLLWAGPRLRGMNAHMDDLIGACFLICLSGTLFSTMRLEGSYLGQMSRYISIYIMVVAFAILQAPVRVLAPVALASMALALMGALMVDCLPYWLDVFMYFGGPLLICMVTGYIVESSERRNFVQNLLLARESRRLARLNAEAENSMRQQRHLTDFLTLVGGNPSLTELFERTLRFLTERTGAQVGAAYHMTPEGRLRRVSAWGLAADAPPAHRELDPGSTLMGPALQSGELLQLQRVRADYLPVDLGMGRLPSASVLIVPVMQAGHALAVIELGSIRGFSDRDCADTDAIRTHLAYAVAAANARELALTLG